MSGNVVSTGCQEQVNISLPQVCLQGYDIYILIIWKKIIFRCHVYAPMKYIFP